MYRYEVTLVNGEIREFVANVAEMGNTWVLLMFGDRKWIRIRNDEICSIENKGQA